MSPTYFVVHMAAAEKRLEAARLAHDIQGMQSALAEKTRLRQAYYGVPQAR
jgi:hypothetical protein